MIPNSQQTIYARQIAEHLAVIEVEQEKISDLKASAKDAGLNVKAIAKAAKELRMDSDKRAKRYEDEHQLDLLRDALGLTGEAALQAAE